MKHIMVSYIYVKFKIFGIFVRGFGCIDMKVEKLDAKAIIEIVEYLEKKINSKQVVILSITTLDN